MASASAPKRLGVRLELHAERADGVDDARQRRVGCAHVRDGDARVEAERAVAVEERELARSSARLRWRACGASSRRRRSRRSPPACRPPRARGGTARRSRRGFARGPAPPRGPGPCRQGAPPPRRTTRSRPRECRGRPRRRGGETAARLPCRAPRRRARSGLLRGAPRWRRAPAARREEAAPRARPGTGAACERASRNHAPPGAGCRRRRARSTRCRSGRSRCRRA